MANMADPSGASQYGGPVYDAATDPADAGIEAFAAARLQEARDLHLFDSKSAAAEAYSHVFEQTPNRTAIAMMGLAEERDAIERTVQQQWQLPFPGVPLGSLPPLQRAPDTNPIIGDHSHLHHHAHHVESKRATRRRFAR